ncbi:MAG: hypothetical protein M3Z66_06475, partial [Chloroflexota bacterium]|nr:hypothetical protein [Chloroflexota bacterium]
MLNWGAAMRYDKLVNVMGQEQGWSSVGPTASDDRPGYLQLIDMNTAGSRCDVTPLFEDGVAFA